MHAFFDAKRTVALFLASVLVLVAVFGVAAAQEEEAVAETAMIPETDSLATAMNDSTELAAEIQALIKKEQSGFVNRLKRSGIGQNYIKGGNFMHPLLLASIIALVFIIERFWTLSRARINVKGLMQKIIRNLREEGIQSALEVCQRTRGPIAAILHSGLLRADKGPDAVEKAIETAGTIEMSFLERGLVALATIGNVAPLLGFLGTVSGMISAFAAIAAAEQVSAKLVAKGIQEALITTATGLIIAVPVTIMHNFFVSQIDRFIIEMEEASATVINELIEMETSA
ncbi:MAG: MotA/TolQ/ExbB proton channel family protein [Candidatus Latescibacteria bacterium]|nr:MotA/TolQ/ExbB proton channel family protein [Candidatus Latescibacterota bacterium]NIO27304.1 MotA/TolQ/ExbB proton channel family protein [Candidatus Latescibacterota bacterium]NIO54828.1 MotA/TolQ/ExbB proton channel family protein [Candidatus Latescibacterota bacterium]NIT00911.1 MotA/TolQ/ExbB proton channel family protein [Candidatus Latescibacterota bacterium]NIT37834.1 MotA/TolQ/ExbB proton channel family protein [Candidatus Latescibacterota bacterium]